MNHPQRRSLASALALLAALAILLPATPARSAPVMRQIPYSYTTKLPLGTTPVQFRFSLVNSANQVLWSEVKSYALKTSKVVKHQLGSVDPVNNPIPEASFNEQLRVKLEYLRKTPAPARYVTIATTNLALAPYALWSAASETPGPAGADGLACWDGNGSGACDLGTEDLNTDGACDALDCVGPRGLAGPDGAQGPQGATGAAGPAGPACWDLDGNELCALPGEDFNGDGACSVLDCGQKCWDLNRNGACDTATEDLNLDTLCTVLDCTGPRGSTGSQGPQGAQGLQGPAGPSGGLACWDLNGNGLGDPAEDVNLDTFYTAADCTGPEGPAGAAGPSGPAGPLGPAGATGPAGTQGPVGTPCWDLNSNSVCDPTEDKVLPLGCTIADCAGPTGPRGLTGIQGPRGYPCWDLNSNGVCDASENTDGVLGCTIADCKGPRGDAGAPGNLGVAGCATGQTMVWNGTNWACGDFGGTACTNYFFDSDGDGFGTSSFLCLPAPSGLYTAKEGGDLDDANCLVNPDMVWFLNSRTGDMPEWCNNGRDDDLDLSTDNACDIFLLSLGTDAQGRPTATGKFDRDGDGYFTDAGETLPVWFGACLGGSGFVFDPAPAPDPLSLGDCDNLDATIHPGATDSCDGLDQNCDGTDGLPEACANSVDDDCDGVVDEAGCL